MDHNEKNENNSQQGSYYYYGGGSSDAGQSGTDGYRPDENPSYTNYNYQQNENQRYYQNWGQDTQGPTGQQGYGYQQPGNEAYGYRQAEDAVFTSYQGQGPKPKKEHPVRNKIFKTIAVALVFGLVAGTTFTGTTYFFRSVIGDDTEEVQETKSGADLNIVSDTESNQTAEQSPQANEVMNVSTIVAQTMPSIVSITNMGVTEYQNFFGQTQEYESESAGSGIIISQDEDYLYIATNNHVVSGAKTLTVKFHDEETVSAEIKGTDPSSDLAVVSVELSSIKDETKKEIRTAVFGDSSTMKVGQTAIAIGNALGYGQSVTTGVISAVNREVSVQDETTGNAVTNQLIQTDAAINPGNSGGALLNASGEVIGINSVKYTNTAVEGMGYAIPSASAIPIIQELITREAVSASDTGYLGISGVDVTEQVAGTYNMPKGVYIAKVVTGSAAEEAGLKQGDIITKFAGRNISSMSEIQDILKYYSAGTEVELTIQRAVDGTYTESTVNVTLGRK